MDGGNQNGRQDIAMDAVIKVGGSLAEKPAVLKAFCNRLSEIAREHSVVVVPGGGKFADAVRECDQQYSLSADAAHKMAILGMDQFGLLLSQVTPNSCTTYSLSTAKRLSEGKTAPIFLPGRPDSASPAARRSRREMPMATAM